MNWVGEPNVLHREHITDVDGDNCGNSKVCRMKVHDVSRGKASYVITDIKTGA